MRALRPTTFRGLGINMLTCRGKLDAIGGSVGALPERDVFSGGLRQPVATADRRVWPSHDPARQDLVQERPGSDRNLRSRGRIASRSSGIHRARDRGFTRFRSQPFSLRVSSDVRGTRGSGAIDDAHTEHPVWDGQARVRTEGPRGGSACVTQVLTVQVYSQPLRWWGLS